jgi:hypothetical protein
MRVVVATHGHCFDGLASAVVFTRLLRELDRATNCEYRACGYGVGQLHVDDQVLSGDQNAILDYRFFASDRLTWYFDHHRTAFRSPDDRAMFEARAESGRYFFDPGYASCTKLIADIARERFGMVDGRLDELVRWADVVDSARFESAEQAVNRENPVLRLVTVIEHQGDDAFLAKLVPQLLEQPLAQVASSAEVERRYRPLGDKYTRFVERVRAKAEVGPRVVFVDLTDAVLETVGKFVTYALYPEAAYSVIVGRLKSGIKVSVGYNPWSGQKLDVDISAICARYGGGGHPVVGGISFDTAELERARMIARDIADELSGARSASGDR